MRERDLTDDADRLGTNVDSDKTRVDGLKGADLATDETYMESIANLVELTEPADQTNGPLIYSE